MVQVTFLGTGAAFSTRRRSNIALLVREANTSLAVECGPTILYQLDQAGLAPDQIDHLFISHRHGDHLLGLPMFLLMCSLGGTPRPLTILGGKDTIQAGQEITHLVYPELDDRLDEVTWSEIPVDKPHSTQLMPSIKLSTLPMQHGRYVSVLGLRLDFQESGRSLVYTGDTSYNEKLVSFAADCDLLVHEANYSERLQPGINAVHYGHSTAHQAGLIAAEANSGVLALVHLNPEYVGREKEVCAEAAQAFDGQIIIPSDGATIFL